MKLEDHVPSLELCKRWKEIRGRQDTNLYWVRLVGKENFILMARDSDDTFVGMTPDNYSDWYYVDTCECFAAPLASELMEWMKEKYKDRQLTSMEVVSKIMNYLSGYYVDSLPNALMKMEIETKVEGK